MFRNSRGDQHEYHLLNDKFYQELSNDSHKEVVFKIYGYQVNKIRFFVYHLVSVLLIGIPYVLSRIFHSIKKLKYTKASLNDATIILVCDNYGNKNFAQVQVDGVYLKGTGLIRLRYFNHHHTKYVWSTESDSFQTLDNIIPPITLDEYLNNNNGLLNTEYNNLVKLYGENKIEIKVKSYWFLFIEEVFHPFYMFQAFSIILWCFDDYMIYAVCVAVLTLFSSVTSLIQTRKQNEALHNLVESSKCKEVNVMRQNTMLVNNIEEIDPSQLVPGDLIVLPASNFIMPCDAVLITGECIVNESVLTGESVPITKTAIHSSADIYNVTKHNRHTLFCGTTMIQTRYYSGEKVLARVVRVGFDTTKGALVKSILFPATVDLEFYKDSFKFLLALFVIAISGMGYCLYLYIQKGEEVKEIILRTLDIVTIVVPPALPAAMVMGTVYSQSRLKKRGIFCTSPPRITVCGKIKLACFDKTGTLTHDGLDLNYVVPSFNATFENPVSQVCSLDNNGKLIQGMATCHSLTRIDGVLNGDPIDLKMFEFTKWELEEPGDDENRRYDMLAPTVVKPCIIQQDTRESADIYISNEIGIIRQFPFSSTQQCMSVICRSLSSAHMTVFTKGAPEKLKIICNAATVPTDFSEKLTKYTKEGYRVIALGYKDLSKNFKWKDAQKVRRNLVESDMNFLGFLIMQNPLKTETAPVIKSLHHANIRTVMVTGDNILTAVSVARDCGMVEVYDKILIVSANIDDGDPNILPKILIEEAGTGGDPITDMISINFSSYHFAIDGRTWDIINNYYAYMIPHFLVRSTIFARFQPDQKTQLVTCFQDLNYIVAMVGDGANDCGALKAAHVGVSLSQAEASVAAPFTSSISNISCIIELILEGRCALVTSFAIFKYMATYSLIQFFSILILYKCNSILGDFQFLFIDLVVTTSLAVTIGRQGPCRKLSWRRPTSSLVSPKIILPLILQIGLCAFFQLTSLFYLYRQSWFKPIDSNGEQKITAWENTVIFTVSSYQYIILACVFSKGRPHREKIIKNFWLIFTAVSLTACTVWMMVYPCDKMAEIMNLMDASQHPHFRMRLLVIPVAQFAISMLIELGISERIWFKKLLQTLRGKKVPKNKYKILLQDETFYTTLNSLSHTRR